MEKEFRFKIRLETNEITAKGKDEEDAKINALTEISFNPHEYLELEKM